MVGCKKLGAVGVVADEGRFIDGFNWFKIADSGTLAERLSAIQCGYRTLSPPGNWMCQACASRLGWIW